MLKDLRIENQRIFPDAFKGHFGGVLNGLSKSYVVGLGLGLSGGFFQVFFRGFQGVLLKFFKLPFWELWILFQR